MERPTSVTVYGILNLVFTAFGIFGLVLMVALFFERASRRQQSGDQAHS